MDPLIGYEGYHELFEDLLFMLRQHDIFTLVDATTFGPNYWSPRLERWEAPPFGSTTH